MRIWLSAPCSLPTMHDVRWLKNICMKALEGGDFEMTLTPVKFIRLTPEELREHRDRAGFKTLPAIDDE